ncbi:MAG: tRNA(fMet)-specific endonuclease VapC [Planctomycetes bacterium ADurb.Bin126]|mgnify:CR=1 FL=1|nr:MAG: tRNA(fMet)-specific endonuclease VapC [Planctomycetes bacterium ADurb.Bin126]HOD80773.1 type II toxin-antitoxin system VapC family toxin [Phycisphaerae bacterium]HQL72072.1 type II toxin-antitoxin system VapC family toxin [Phycisphaerae bacterium]
MIRVLLDSCTCIELLRGRAPRVRRRLEKLAPDQAAISCITLAELQYGAAKSSDPARHAELLAKFCAPLSILPFDSVASTTYGRVRRELERQGTPIGPLDTLIAAHALSLNLMLITGNLGEFSRVRGLCVKDWQG